MSKKGKGTVEERRIILGRPGNNVKMGIVGLPNVGKSSLFNTLTKLTVPAENYPFCTIDPNVDTSRERVCSVLFLILVCFSLRRVAVPDDRFDWLVNLHKPASVVSAFLTVTDIAGTSTCNNIIM